MSRVGNDDVVGTARLEVISEPLGNWAHAERLTACVVFTDIVNSTRHANALGNEHWDFLRNRHFQTGAALARSHQGHVVKSTGDGLLVLFRTSVEATGFALDYCHDTGAPDIEIKIALHVGKIEVQGEDVFGTTVNLAAQILANARKQSIWISDRVKSDLDEERSLTHRHLYWTCYRDVSLKGFTQPVTIWSATVERQT